MPDADHLESLANQVADGAVVDWDAAAARQPDVEGRSLVRRLESLAHIALQHRVVGGDFGVGAVRDSGVPQSWGHLHVLTRVGSGASSEVFRAWDPQLDREVALKLFRPGSDATRRAHLEEARRLARVRHANVLTVLGVDEHDGRAGIWTEFINGTTLADLVSRDGPLEPTAAIAIGRTLARALSALHRAGLLHRDIKPSNAMQEDSGRIVLMDLGISTDAAAGHRDRAAGTPVAVAPEVLAGVKETAQSDIYGIGVVLFFLLTGAYPVDGGSLDQVVESHRENRRRRLSSVRPGLPAGLVRVVERTLDADPSRRYASADALDAALAGVDPVHPSPAPARYGRSLPWPWVVAVVLMAAIATFAISRPPSVRQSLSGAFVVPAPSGTELGSVALTRDGRMLAFVATDAARVNALWVRPVNELRARKLPGSEGASLPFWSFDGRSVGYFAGGALKVQGLDGGPSRAIARTPDPRGGVWMGDGVIVFAPNTSGGLVRVAAIGGAVSQATELQHGEVSHRFPGVLPDGRHVVYLARTASRAGDALFVALPGASPVRLLAGRSNAAIAPDGRLILWRDGSLVAHRIDLSSFRVASNADVVAANVTFLADRGQALFATSESGALVFRSGAIQQSQLTWFDREGRALGTLGLPRNYRGIELSPDGQRLAAEWLDPAEGTDDIWLFDLARDVTARLTFSPANDGDPVWSPDGSRLLYTSNADGQYRLYEKTVAGEAIEQPWPAQPKPVFPEDWSPDGRTIVMTAGEEGNRDLYIAAPQGPMRRLFTREFDRDEAQFAPGGHQIAYHSGESGRSEVFLADLEDTTRQVQVSPAGGAQARWRADGRELFFLALDGSMMSVPVVAGTLRVGPARRLFQPSLDTSTMLNQFAVSPDGNRFLILIPQADRSGQHYTLLLP